MLGVSAVNAASVALVVAETSAGVRVPRCIAATD